MRCQSVAIVLAGENTLFREGVVSILAASNVPVAASEPYITAFDVASLEYRYGSVVLIVLDDGSQARPAIHALEALKARHSQLRVIVLVNQWRPADVVALFKAGVSACLIETRSSDILVRSIEAVLGGTPFIVFPETMSGAAAGDQIFKAIAECEGTAQPAANKLLHVDGNRSGKFDPVPQLSPCEDRILRRLIAGDSNKAIARALNIAETTVKTHIKAILRKVNVKNRTQAAIWAANNMPPDNGIAVEPLSHALAHPIGPHGHMSNGRIVHSSIAPQLVPDGLPEIDEEYPF